MKKYITITFAIGGVAVLASLYTFSPAAATISDDRTLFPTLNLAPWSGCGIGYSGDRHYVHPGGTTAWTIGVTKVDPNGDGIYNSSMKFESVPYPEYNWASFSPSSYVPTLSLANASPSESVTAHALANTLGLPFGVNDFQVVHTCETLNPEVGLSVAAPANLTIIPYYITGLAAHFSETTNGNVVLTWNEFSETPLNHVAIYRVENGDINQTNYESAELVATLSPDSTSYEITGTDTCRNYSYAVYGFSATRLMAVSDTVTNNQYGEPKPFSLLSPTENATVNDSAFTFDWEDAERSYPGEDIVYMFSLFDPADLVNPVFVATTTSSNYTYSSLTSRDYIWKVKATNACGFETYGSSKENIAASDAGGVISTVGGSVTNLGSINDGKHGTGAAFSAGLEQIGLTIPATGAVNRMRLDYTLAQSGNNVPKTHRLTFFNGTAMLNTKRGITDGMHTLADVSFTPQSSSQLNISMAMDALNVDYYGGTLYEFEAYAAQSNFSVSVKPTTPTALLCDGTPCGVTTVDTQTQLTCQGSTDPDADVITYDLEAYYDKNLGTEWGNNGWDLKRKITVSENSGRTLTDYPVLIHVTYDSDMKSDFSDLRFLDSSEQQELPYWISSHVTGTSADIRVKLPELPANQDVTLYMYYGNPSASTTSNQAAVCPAGITTDVENNAACWIYREDFNADVFGTPYWSRSQGPYYVYTSNGWLRFSEGATGQWAKYQPPSPIVSLSDHKDIAIETRSRFDELRGRGYKSGYHNILTGTDEVTYAARSGTEWVVNNIWTGVGTPDPQTPVWVRMRAWYSTSEETLYANVNDGTPLTEIVTVLGNVSPLTGLVWRPHWAIEMAIDWVGIRKYTNTEPTVQIGAEEAEDGTFWYHIGSHPELSAYTWDTSNITEQSNINVRCRAIDPTGSNTYSEYYDPGASITVFHNTPPVLVHVMNQTIDETSPLSIQLIATDPDPQTLEYGLSGSLPSPYSFSISTGLFEWTPTQYDAGIYPLIMSVSDGIATDEQLVIITVINVPGPPELDPIPDITVAERSAVIITPHAADPDNDPLLHTINDPRFTWTGTNFYWRPGPTDSGEYDVIVTVTEQIVGGVSVQDDVHITVTDKCKTYDKRNACWVECTCPSNLNLTPDSLDR